MSQIIRRIGARTWLVLAGLIWIATLARTSAVAPEHPGTVNDSAGPRNSSQVSDSARPEVPPIYRGTSRRAAEAGQATQTAAQVPQGERLVGEKECISCHADQRKGYYDSPHHQSKDPRTPAAKLACETCHGPAGKHADDPVNVPIRNFKTTKPGEVAAVCTTCHNRGEHKLWDESQHEGRGLSCVTCHSVHAPQSENGQLKKKTQLELCATCHRDKVAKLDRSGHMPVREGKMQCSTCHNTHGATNVKMLRTGDSIAELCTSCHADKRGPYLWEHAPSRDGCVTCHDPHGSSNERMLVSKPPLLCQRCHVGTRHPSTIYDDALMGAGSNPSIRVYGRTCVTCHAAIHGSNHPSGQRFIR